MYVLLPAALVFFIILSLIFCFRRRHIIKKVKAMSMCDKCCLLNRLIKPFGFEYELSQNIFVSRRDAPQRDYGYCSMYDRGAVYFNMVFDCEPVYFDYEGCTWLLEFWKGQYGINLGAEVGLYKADRIIPEHSRENAHFHSIDDCEMPVFDTALFKNGVPVYHLCQEHWWLAGFSMGQYAEPGQLDMMLRITFPDCEMCASFVDGLISAGYRKEEIHYCKNSVSLSFYTCASCRDYPFRKCLSVLAQWENRLFLRIFCRATKPFCHTVDKLLYLYEYLPFAFRHMFCIRRRKHGRRGRRI